MDKVKLEELDFETEKERNTASIILKYINTFNSFMDDETGENKFVECVKEITNPL